MVAEIGSDAPGNEPIGELVRTRRTRIGMSVRSLAKHSGFSASFISQVENGQASPSIASLQKIAAALGVTLGGFFASEAGSETDVPSVVRFNRGRRLNSDWSMASVVSLGGSGQPNPFESLMITLAPGGRSGRDPEGYPAAIFAFVHSGLIVLRSKEAVHTLNTGDAVTIPRHVPHVWENLSDEPVSIVLVSSRSDLSPSTISVLPGVRKKSE